MATFCSGWYASSEDSLMEDTQCGDKCAFVKAGICKDCEGCPNYVESWWTTQGSTTPKLIKDCAPRRLMIQQQYLQLRVEQLTADSNAARAEYTQVSNYLGEMLKISKTMEAQDAFKYNLCPVTSGLLLQSDNEINH